MDREVIGRDVSRRAERAGFVRDWAVRTAAPRTTTALMPEYRREMIRMFTKCAALAAAGK
jgi:hypothetical protein